MTNEQILKKAIEKAFGDCTEEYAKSQIERDGGYRVIFSHSFAKAFWGEEPLFLFYTKDGWYVGKSKYLSARRKVNQGYRQTPTWQYHLQLMVLEKEPIQYLRKFLEEK